MQQGLPKKGDLFLNSVRIHFSQAAQKGRPEDERSSLRLAPKAPKAILIPIDL